MARGLRAPLVTVATAAGLALALAPAAMAQGTTDTFYFAHDDTLQDTESGLFSLGPFDATAQPDEQRLGLPEFLDAFDDNDNFEVPPAENLREVFEFEVPDEDVNGSFTAQLNWANPTIDLDMYIYRRRPNGTIDPTPVAQSATANDEEIATYISPTLDAPVESDDDGTPSYVIYVDNWCSSEDDPIVNELREFFGDPPGTPECGVDDPGIDEDDFSGKVEFAPLVLTNKLPSAGISGPTTGRAGDRLTFTGSGSDPDGQIVRYTFDLDGDGNFEYDNAIEPVGHEALRPARQLQRRRAGLRRPRRRRLRQPAAPGQRPAGPGGARARPSPSRPTRCCTASSSTGRCSAATGTARS